jgi:hypothetical protein
VKLHNLLGKCLWFGWGDGGVQRELQGGGIGGAINLRLEGLSPSGTSRGIGTESSHRYREESRAGNRGPGLPRCKGSDIERDGSPLKKSHRQSGFFEAWTGKLHAIEHYWLVEVRTSAAMMDSCTRERALKIPKRSFLAIHCQKRIGRGGC